MKKEWQAYLAQLQPDGVLKHPCGREVFNAVYSQAIVILQCPQHGRGSFSADIDTQPHSDCGLREASML